MKRGRLIVRDLNESESVNSEEYFSIGRLFVKKFTYKLDNWRSTSSKSKVRNGLIL